MFKYEPTEVGYEVTHRGRVIGEMETIIEASGRYSFCLVGDPDPDDPRIYRGKHKAAEALLVIDEIKRKHKSVDSMIMAAFRNRPRGSEAA